MNDPVSLPLTEEQADLERWYVDWSREALARYVPIDSPQFAHASGWVQRRFRDGVELGGFIRSRLEGDTLRVLDVGAGNGGITMGMSAVPGLHVTACDHAAFPEVPEIRRQTGARFSYLVAAGQRLPFVSGGFDAVVLLDMIEHVLRPREIASESHRVLRAGGLVVVTTPPRIRFLLRGDPHYDIPGLAWLPRRGQKLVAERLLGRTDHYDVAHLYWTARGVERLFPADLEWDYPRCARKLGRLGVDWDRLVGTRER